MAITKLLVEFKSGPLEAQLNLQTERGTVLVTQLLDAVNLHLRLRRSGAEFEGRVGQKEGGNSGWVTFAQGWAPEDAEKLLDAMNALSQALEPTNQPMLSGREGDSTAKPQNEGFSQKQHITPASPRKQVRLVDPSGWMSNVETADASLFQFMMEHSISSDEQYLELESSLPSEQRTALAKARLEYGLDCASDPSVPGGISLQVLATFTPPWVESIPVHLTGFPVRGRNCLNSAGLTKFSQLAERGLDELLKIPNFGRTTYTAIAVALRDQLMSHASALLEQERAKNSELDPQIAPTNLAFSNFDSLWEAVTNLVEDKSNIEVLSRRIGFGSDGGAETLEAIGQLMGVSRERVRQIQKRAIDRLHNRSEFAHVKSSLESEIARQIALNKGPVYLRADCTVHAFRGPSFEVIKNFLQLILRSEFRVLISNDPDGARSARILRGVGEGELAEALQALEKFITANDFEPYSRFMPAVQTFIEESFDESIHSDLKAFVGEWINWDYSADPRIISFGDSIEAAAAAVLERSTRPLTLVELIETAQNDFGLDQTENSIRNAVNSLCLHPGRRTRHDVCVGVFQVSRGEFGTKRHLPIDLDALGHLIPTLCEIISGGRECLIPDQPYQWHGDCLWKELKNRLPANELAGLNESDRWRAIDWLLRYYEPKGVVNLRKGRWAKELPGTNQTDRSRDDAIIWILKEHLGVNRARHDDVERLLLRIQSPGVSRNVSNQNSRVKSHAGEYWIEG